MATETTLDPAHSEVVLVAHDVGTARPALAHVDPSTRVLLGVAGLDHPGQDLRGCRVVVALDGDVAQLVLELQDPLRLLDLLDLAELLSLVLACDVGLLTPALRPNLKQVGTDTSQRCSGQGELVSYDTEKGVKASTYSTRATTPGTHGESRGPC